VKHGLTTRLALLLVATLMIADACQRKPRFEPMRDSTGALVDSITVLEREVQDLWDSGPSDDAAAASARILFERLRDLKASDWKHRADQFLDSLGVGSETAAAPCVLAVNFFARSDPASGSWPYLYWCGEEGARYQPVEGRDLRLLSLQSRGFQSDRSAGPAGLRGAAALFARRAGGGQQPLLMVWSVSSGAKKWDLVQTLGPDSLGGVGTGEFERPGDAVELVARTYRTPGYFEECATCPHVFELHRFRWGAEGFNRVEDKLVPSPYSTFVAFIRAVMANDDDLAETFVSKRSLVGAARRFDWQKPRGIWRIAPATDETPQQMVFFRGQEEAYRVEFERNGEAWLIAGFEPVTRSVE